jgi:ribulose-phosphate 3-epimerase
MIELVIRLRLLEGVFSRAWTCLTPLALSPQFVKECDEPHGDNMAAGLKSRLDSSRAGFSERYTAADLPGLNYSAFCMPRCSQLANLRAARPAILPSLLMCDFGRLEDEVRRLEEAHVPALHLDIMDGHFVPNLSYGLVLVETFRRLTDLPLDLHLMISNPGEYVERYREAGGDSITIHAEAVDDPRPVLEKIRSLGAGAGLAINPPTPVSAIEGCLDLCDLVLVMSVMPGFGGQHFDPTALEKLQDLKSRVRPETLLEVDGGVNSETIADCARAGAQLFVVGSAIFKGGNYTASTAHLRELAQSPQLEPH